MTSDSYLCISKKAQGIYKEKGSKFLAFAFPAGSENTAKKKIHQLKKKYHDAQHCCYAFLIDEKYREHDDGEPPSTAGRPILNQIRSYDLNHILIVVIRYFGGTKLGIGGLINAYKSAAKTAIENTEIITKYITANLSFTFKYENTSEVMRIINNFEAKIEKQKFTENCFVIISIRKNDWKKIYKRLHPFVQFLS